MNLAFYDMMNFIYSRKMHKKSVSGRNRERGEIWPMRNIQRAGP